MSENNEKAQLPYDNTIHLKDPLESDTELLKEMSKMFRDKARECNKLNSRISDLEAKCKKQEEALKKLESDNSALKNNNRCLKKALGKFDTEVTSLDSIPNLVCVRCGKEALNGKKEGDHCGQMHSHNTLFCSGKIATEALKP